MEKESNLKKLENNDSAKVSKIKKILTIQQPNNSTHQKKKIEISDFKLLETLGRGAYAKVVLAEKGGQQFAHKIIDKKIIDKYEKKHEVHTEKQVLSSLNHRSIIKLHSSFQDHKSLYFLLDYCRNKDLGDFLRTNVILSKELAQFYSAEIVNALDHLRFHGISHRDLKPENIMLDEKMKIKLVLFLFRLILLQQLKRDMYLIVFKTNLLLRLNLNNLNLDFPQMKNKYIH